MTPINPPTTPNMIAPLPSLVGTRGSGGWTLSGASRGVLGVWDGSRGRGLDGGHDGLRVVETQKGRRVVDVTRGFTAGRTSTIPHSENEILCFRNVPNLLVKFKLVNILGLSNY